MLKELKVIVHWHWCYWALALQGFQQHLKGRFPLKTGFFCGTWGCRGASRRAGTKAPRGEFPGGPRRGRTLWGGRALAAGPGRDGGGDGGALGGAARGAQPRRPAGAAGPRLHRHDPGAGQGGAPGPGRGEGRGAPGLVSAVQALGRSPEASPQLSPRSGGFWRALVAPGGGGGNLGSLILPAAPVELFLWCFSSSPPPFRSSWVTKTSLRKRWVLWTGGASCFSRFVSGAEEGLIPFPISQVTGSGKTLAFVIPVIEILLRREQKLKKMQVRLRCSVLNGLLCSYDPSVRLGTSVKAPVSQTEYT